MTSNTQPDLIHPAALAYAKAYRCTDCHGEAAAIRLDRLGIWHVEIVHDDSCPVLTGAVSPAQAGIAAAARTADATGQRVAYLAGR